MIRQIGPQTIHFLINWLLSSWTDCESKSHRPSYPRSGEWVNIFWSSHYQHLHVLGGVDVLQHSCEWHDGLLEFASCGYWGQNQNTMGPSQGRTKCLPFKFSPWIWGSKTSKPFNQSTPSCNFMWLRSPNANSIPVFFLLVRTLGKDFDTFIQPGRCKGWMSPWNMALNVMLWFLSFTGLFLLI